MFQLLSISLPPFHMSYHRMYEENTGEASIRVKNRLFLQNGHDCNFAGELDKVAKFVPGTDIKSVLKRFYLRLILISETNVLVDQYFRSQGAIAHEKYRQLKHNHVYIIHPFSDVRRWWELVMVFVFFTEFVVIPLNIGFGVFLVESSFTAAVLPKFINIVVDIMCLIDIGMSFMSGYYDKRRRRVILNPHLIAITFTRGYFLIDLLSSIPQLDLVVPHITRNKLHIIVLVIELMSLLKFFRFKTFIVYANRSAKKYGVSFSTFNGLLITGCYCLYYHLICCALLFLTITGRIRGAEISQSTSELQIKGENTEMYLRTFYMGCVIINNAGFGSKPPDNNLITFLIVFLLLISRLARILFIVRMAEIIKARTSTHLKYVEMVRQLREYMRHKQLPEYVQRRLVAYYEFRFQKSYFRESEILSTISGQLRQDIVMGTCRRLVENVRFFNNLPLGLLIRIVASLRLEVFLANDVIIRARTKGECMYFIGSGTVSVYTQSGKEICHLEDGAHFGEIALVAKDHLRIASVVAVEICELYRLDRNDFVKAIFPYPDLLDDMQRIASERTEKTSMLNELYSRERDRSSVSSKARTN